MCISSGGTQEKNKERQDEWNSVFLPPKLMVFWVSSPQAPPWMLMYNFSMFLKNLTLCMTQTQGSGAVFFLLYRQLYYKVLPSLRVKGILHLFIHSLSVK